MRWKSIPIALLLMGIAVLSSVQVQAQAIVLVAMHAVAGVGPEETLEIHWASRPRQASPVQSARPPGSDIPFIIVVTNLDTTSSGTECDQAFSVPVEVSAGLNTLNVSVVDGVELVVNGHLTGVLDSCFAVGGKRNRIAVGRQIHSDLVNRSSGDPNSTAESDFGSQVFIHIYGVYGVVDADGRTLASTSIGAAPYVLRVTGVLNGFARIPD